MFGCRRVDFFVNKPFLLTQRSSWKNCYETTTWNFSLDLVFSMSCSLRTCPPKPYYSLYHYFSLFLLYLSGIMSSLCYWLSKKPHLRFPSWINTCQQGEESQANTTRVKKKHSCGCNVWKKACTLVQKEASHTENFSFWWYLEAITTPEC